MIPTLQKPGLEPTGPQSNRLPGLGPKFNQSTPRSSSEKALTMAVTQLGSSQRA